MYLPAILFSIIVFIDKLRKKVVVNSKQTPSPISKWAHDELRNILLSQLTPNCYISITDEWKYKYKWEDVKKFLKIDTIDEKTYVNNIYDCENFTNDLLKEADKWLPCSTFGELRTLTIPGDKTSAHSVAIFVDENGMVRVMEGQNDKTSLRSELNYEDFFCDLRS